MRILLPLLLCASVGATPPEQPQPVAPGFDPIAFFTGRTEGEGRLHKMLSSARTVRVQGMGRLEPDGTLVLDQLVEEEGAAQRRRQWRIRETSPGRYSGSLTDAQGPVTGEAHGNRLRLRFRMNAGPAVEQWLTVRPDGRTMSNRMNVRMLGMTIASLDETIRKVD